MSSEIRCKRVLLYIAIGIIPCKFYNNPYKYMYIPSKKPTIWPHFDFSLISLMKNEDYNIIITIGLPHLRWRGPNNPFPTKYDSSLTYSFNTKYDSSGIYNHFVQGEGNLPKCQRLAVYKEAFQVVNIADLWDWHERGISLSQYKVVVGTWIFFSYHFFNLSMLVC